MSTQQNIWSNCAIALISGFLLSFSLHAQARQGSGEKMAANVVERNPGANALPRVGVLAYCPAPATDIPENQPAAAVGTLTADGRFGAITLVPADQTLPSAANLQANFDCVVATTDLGCGIPMPDNIADAAADSLAAYAKSGGGVVLTAFDFAQPRPSLGLGGAIFAAGLSPLLGTSIFNSGNAGGIDTAGMSVDPACSKIVEGVTGTLNSSFANDVMLAQNATKCVSYLCGMPAVAVNQGGKVIGFNSSPYSSTDIAQTPYKRLFSNSVYQACTVAATAPQAVVVPVDVDPGTCPNTVNAKSRGKIRIALLGTASVPVSRIDPASIRLSGVAPDKMDYSDVGTPYAPYTGKTSCN